MNPPAERSIQLLKVLVPPSNICSGVSGTAAAVGGVFVSAAQTEETAEQAPIICSSRRKAALVSRAWHEIGLIRVSLRRLLHWLEVFILDFIGFKVANQKRSEELTREPCTASWQPAVQ